MKTKVYDKSYDEVMAMPRRKHQKPIKPNILFRSLMLVASLPDIIATRFKANKIGMERLGKNEPAFFLMNHSSFLDLEIVPTVLYPRRFNIVATTDGSMVLYDKDQPRTEITITAREGWEQWRKK